MGKQEFLTQLRAGLSGLPREDMEERLTFYSEMIDDRMEEGLSEEDAVSGIGPIDTIIAQIISEIPPVKQPKKAATRKQWTAWEIVLLVLGSPIWLSLLISAFAVVFSLYVALWSVIVSMWSVFGSLIACALGSIVACIGFVICRQNSAGLAMIGAGLICAGLSIFMFYACKAATNGTVVLAKKIVCWIKGCFHKKEDLQ